MDDACQHISELIRLAVSRELFIYAVGTHGEQRPVRVHCRPCGGTCEVMLTDEPMKAPERPPALTLLPDPPG